MKDEVIVNNLGTMYQGIDYSEAMRIYEDYAVRSRGSYGRISGKRVTLIDSAMQILRQHKPCNVNMKGGFTSCDIPTRFFFGSILDTLEKSSVSAIK